jgi:hypothetical protein
MEIVYVLWLRQVRRYVRSGSRLLGTLGQPILLLLALGYGIGAIYRRLSAVLGARDSHSNRAAVRRILGDHYSAR